MQSSTAKPPTFPKTSFFDGIFRRDNEIFTVYNGDPEFMLNMPAPLAKPFAMDRTFRSADWSVPIMPYIMFIPRYNPFAGPLFGRLDFKNKSVLLNPDGGWELDNHIIDGWIQLESALRSVCEAMRAELGDREFRAITYFIFPSQMGYRSGPRRSRGGALAIARRSRDSFLPLMAFITLQFLLLSQSHDQSWRDRIIHATQCHPQWFSDLESSVVGRLLDVERVGIIIDMTWHDLEPRQHCLDQLIDFVLGRLPVPLYLYWGAIRKGTDLRVPSALKALNFFPFDRAVDHLNALPGTMAFSPWKWDGKGYVAQGNTDDEPQSTRASPYNLALPDAAQSPATSRQPAASSDDPAASGGRKFPPVERHSGQKEGEDIHAFLARRTAQNLKWAATESSEAKAKRLARENHAAQGAPPGKKGARVFVWEEEDGFLIRRAVNRDNAADMWDEFTPNQRLYDGFSNQWDLSTALAPSEEAGDDDDDGGYEDLFRPDLEFAHLPDVPEAPLPVEPIQEHSTSDDLLRVYRVDSEPSHAADGYEPFVNMEEIPSSRFGFTAPLVPAQYGAPLRPDFYARSLGDEQWPGRNHVKYALLPVMLAYLATAKSLEEVPQELLDLRQDHSDISGLWAVIIEEKTLNSERFYLVRPRDVSEDTQSPHILLKSAATALQVVRMGWESGQEIVFHLLLRGVEFRLCRQGSLRAAPSHRRYSTGLGVRPAGYKPTELDYLAYRTRHDDFLASRRGRAARFAGGIIGRLARDIVLDDIACLGPSDEVFESGVCLWDGQSQTAYWDDDLTPEEIDLICGVYHVETGLQSSADADGVQKKAISWWPKPAAFYLSGMNIGWWSADCERWFLKRRREIESENSKAELWTQIQWKHKIRFIQKSREVALANEKLSAEYLASQRV